MELLILLGWQSTKMSHLAPAEPVGNPDEVTVQDMKKALDNPSRGRTNHRSPLKSSRNEYSRCGASSFIKVRYGALNAHSSSLTSLG